MAELQGVAAKAPMFPSSGFFFRASTKTGGALQEPRVLALHYDEASWAKSGNFCWAHLIHSGTHYDLLEWVAADRWAKRNDQLWKQCMKEAGG
jgi:hypothetical protein